MNQTLIDRFLSYVSFETTSDSSSKTSPSTPGQRVFAKVLAEDLRKAGAENVRITPDSYVLGELKASPGYAKVPVLGLIAHIDTSEEASGKNVHPQIIDHYDGGVIPLGTSGRVLAPERFPELRRMKGETLITTDGTTLLGADDKAGVAEIVTAVEKVVSGNLPHGPIRIAFTTDEEIGQGTDHFDLQEFGADYAYTADGGAVNAIEFSNFNAGMAEFKITGISVHPGSAKGIMRNALKLGPELLAMFPPEQSPEQTDGYEGFFHPLHFTGTVSSAEIQMIIRDHDAAKFEQKKQLVFENVRKMNEKYGPETVRLSWKDQYRNMADVIAKYPFLIDIAERAIRQAGYETVEKPPIRGGTDGAMLSLQGLPCPNLGTGGYNYHGELEYANADEMGKAVQILLNIIREFTDL